MKLVCEFESGVIATSLEFKECNQHPLFEEYIKARDYHYVQKHKWEPKKEEWIDQFDLRSIFVFLHKDTKLLVGARIIQSGTLPVQQVLESEEKGHLVPPGSLELSRFATSLEGSEVSSAEALAMYATAVICYAEKTGKDLMYAVIRRQLKVFFQRLGANISLLSAKKIKHGGSTFEPVVINTTNSNIREVWRKKDSFAA